MKSFKKYLIALGVWIITSLLPIIYMVNIGFAVANFPVYILICIVLGIFSGFLSSWIINKAGL